MKGGKVCTNLLAVMPAAVFICAACFVVTCAAREEAAVGTWEKGVADEFFWYAADAASGAGFEGWEEVFDLVPPPPEQELDLGAKTPQASLNFVYLVASQRDSVVKIDSKTLKVSVIPVGGNPTTLATIPQQDTAVVIDKGTQDIAVIRSTAEEDVVTFLPSLPNVNAIAVSPIGQYAVVYYNSSIAAEDEPAGQLQTIEIVVLGQGEETTKLVSVGFNPSDIVFSSMEPTAYVVTDYGICVVELDKVKDGAIVQEILSSNDPLEKPSDREVLVNADEKYAVVRSLTKPRINVVDLEEGTLSEVDLPGLPTDVDFVPGSDRVLVMLREQEKALVVNVAAVLAESDSNSVTVIDISGTGAGAAQVVPDGSKAVLYSTVSSLKAVTVLHLDKKGYPHTTYPLQKAALGVLISQEGRTAAILHEKEPVQPEMSEIDAIVAQTEGLTLLNLNSGYRKLIQTDLPWKDLLFIATPKGFDNKLFLLTAQGTSASIYSIDLTSYLSTPLELTAPPISMTYVPGAQKVAVAQDHVNGQITFIDVNSNTTELVSGYELNGLIH